MSNKRNAVTYNITREPYTGIQMTVLLIREILNTNVYQYSSMQTTYAMEERQADIIQLANVAVVIPGAVVYFGKSRK